MRQCVVLHSGGGFAYVVLACVHACLDGDFKIEHEQKGAGAFFFARVGAGICGRGVYCDWFWCAARPSSGGVAAFVLCECIAGGGGGGGAGEGGGVRGGGGGGRG